jgi:predicted transcriptional regulator
MSTQMIVRLSPELKEKLDKLARSEGKSTNRMVLEIIEDYVKERDIGAYVDDLWARLGTKLAVRNVTPRDVEQAIDRARGKTG